jgi:antirepressor protein
MIRNMGYKHKIFKFHGDPINFFVNGERVLVSPFSIVTSIGISWGGQYSRLKKLKFVNGLSHVRIPDSQCRRMLGVERKKIGAWLSKINKENFREEKHAKISKYQSEFLKFSYDCIKCDSQIEQEDFYLESKDGLRQLINDSVIWLGNTNAVDQLVDVLFPLMNEEVLSAENISLINPVYDLAEKTADRQGEIIKHKSSSIASQINDVSAKIRDMDRKASLELKRIAKGIR